MSRVLSELLGATEPDFTKTIRQLETESGNPDVDIRLASDVTNKVRLKIRELGLDPNDTSGKELYHSLQGLIGLHDSFLQKAMDIKSSDNYQEIVQKILTHVDKLAMPKTTWALKPATAKRMLKSNPAKRLMKSLGYRSNDSMLKREKIDELMILAKLLETKTWLSGLQAQYKKLSPLDFETRKIGVVNLTTPKFESILEGQDNESPITVAPEMGLLVINPMHTAHKGLTITLLPLIIHNFNELRVYGSYLKLHQVKPNFAALLIDVLTKEPSDIVKLAGQPLHWRTIQLRWGKHNVVDSHQHFEPYLQADDLIWQNSEDLLYKLEPALKFWEGLDIVAAGFDKTPVSLGLLDNAVSFNNNLEYGQHSVGYFRNSLYNELYARYLGEQNFERQVLKQLDSVAESPDIMFSELEGIA